MAYTQNDIGGFYQKYLGRGLQNPGEAQGWLNDPNAEQNIMNSGEAQAYAARGPQASASPVAQQPLSPSPAAPASAYDRNALSQAFQQKQFSGNANIDLGSFLGGLGGIAQGVQQISPDKIRLPDGEVVDVVSNVGTNGQGGAWWGSEGDWAAANARGAYGAPSSGGGDGAPAGGGLTGTSTSSSTYGNVDPAFRDILLQLMNRSQPGAINVATDPNLASQADAYSVARQRAAGRERAMTAERAAAEGLNSGGQGSGAFDTSLQGINENAGRDIAGYNAGLVGQEVQARRNDLLNALQIANSVGARDQSSAIQQQLAALDNQYRYAALAQNQGQFNDTYGLNKAQLEAEANRNAILSLLSQGG
jgi:hypothetical protein